MDKRKSRLDESFENIFVSCHDFKLSPRFKFFATASRSHRQAKNWTLPNPSKCHTVQG